MEQKAILLAEDDPAHAKLIQRALEQTQNNCRLEIVGSGAELIEYLFAAGAHAGRDLTQMPDLVLLDLAMPKMGGLQALQVLRRVRSDEHLCLPPVVIFSASVKEADVVEAYRLGAHSYVLKPAEFSQFIDAIRQIAVYWLELNQPLPRSVAVGPPHYVTRPARSEKR